MREIKLCPFCKVDTERFGCFCIPEKDPNDHVSKKALREWCEEKAVEVLAIRLGYLTDRECLTKEETIEHFEAAWKACTGENWQNFREQKRAEAKQLLGVR